MTGNPEICIPVHTKIPGRVRFKIRSDGFTPGLLQWIGAEVRRFGAVHEVRINSTTGSMLVFFDPETDWRDIVFSVNEAIWNWRVDGTPAPSESGGAPEDRMARSFFNDTAAEFRRWHTLDRDQVVEMTGASIEQGLDTNTVHQRIRMQGFNVIRESRLRSPVETLKDQVAGLPLALLFVESAAALFGGAVLEALLLSAVTAANVLTGYLVDRRSERTIAMIKQRPRPPAKALRCGVWVETPGEQLVIGDVVRLDPGTYVGADCRIIHATCLKIDESILTGESNPVDKHAGVIPVSSTPLFDQRNMAFMGTLVVGGEGVAVAVAAGMATEYGKLSLLYSETIPPQTPVVEKIHDLSGTLLKAALVMSFGACVSGLLRGRSLLQSIGSALAIAAAGMPAGLPSAAAANMALGFKRLQEKHITIRRLYSLESLSAVQMICFDKTGTLTHSRLNVQKIYCSGREISLKDNHFRVGSETVSPVDEPDLKQLFNACLLCSESRIQPDSKSGGSRFRGSPTESALLKMAVSGGLDPETVYSRYTLINVRHRSDSQRYMMTYHSDPDGRMVVYVKGDPTEVLDMCARELFHGRPVDISDETKNKIEIENQKMAGDALRVLGFAYAVIDSSFSESAAPPYVDLIWIGLTGMSEPVRKGVRNLMDELHQAGIQTVMITGDQSPTAEAVARRIRLSESGGPRIFDSSRFDALPPDLAAALIRDVQVFARVNPDQKLQIIQSYQNLGLVVAMTGDGINDGPAMRAADIGVAMGRSGTDAAREVADIVLERDNITSVAAAVMEGRASYRNLKRSLRYFISTHFSELALSTAASAIPGGRSLTVFRPIQVNLLTELAPGLALLMEPARADIAHEPPRDRDAPLFSKQDLLDLLAESSILAGGALAAFGYGALQYGTGARAAALAYESLSTAKLLHSLTCRPWRPEKTAPDSGTANRPLNIALAGTLAAQAGTLFIPGLRRILNKPPLNLTDIAVIGLASLFTRSVNWLIRKKRWAETHNNASHDP